MITRRPRTEGLPARAKSAKKPAPIREDLDERLLSTLTPEELDHVFLGILHNFQMEFYPQENRPGWFVLSPHGSCDKHHFNGGSNRVEQVWSFAEKLTGAEDADQPIPYTLTDKGRAALAGPRCNGGLPASAMPLVRKHAKQLVRWLFTCGSAKGLKVADRLAMEFNGKPDGSGWNQDAMVAVVVHRLTHQILPKLIPQLVPPSLPSRPSVQNIPEQKAAKEAKGLGEMFGPHGRPTTALRIQFKCQQLADLLLAKNKSYGDSALNPTRIFSQAGARAGLAVRIDDKLSRIANAKGAFGEDPVLDLVGYLLFWLIQDDLDRESESTQLRSAGRVPPTK